MAKDLFSKQAADYSMWRPTYPQELIEYILSFVQHRDTAWDCATGNGQAAVLLAEHVEQVMATDLSSEQLKYARQHPRITYRQCPAERTDFADASFDLVTVAQAYHWFDHQAFCKEARRVCKPGALVGIWGYDLCHTSDTAVNDGFLHFYKDVTDPYWDERRRLVEDHYTTVYFDFDEIPVHQSFSIRTTWTIRDLEGYLNSWSAVQKYIKVHGDNPVTHFITELSAIWEPGKPLEFEFPLFLRLGKT